MSERNKTLYSIIALQMVILVFAVLIGRSLGKAQGRDVVTHSPGFDMIGEAVGYIKERYREEDVDEQKLVYGAIKGMIESLDDPYSHFMSPEMYRETMDDTLGKFGGLGIEISITVVNGYQRLTVISPLEGTPAHKSGVEAGDYIVKIDGESTFGISLETAKQKLRGKPGTKVTIAVMREGEDELIDIDIVRGMIEVTTVKSRILEGDVGYIKISQFADTTPKSVDKALDELEKAKVKGIILDLRTNPGGTLSAAVEVASDFLRPGQLIVYTKGRGHYKEYKAKGNNSHNMSPLVVLVDRWSASGSEIVVGAIKDHKRGLIVGNEHSTFGKGSVQTIFPMQDGQTALKLTVFNYYTPSGKNINKVGINPDISLPGTTLTISEAKMYRRLRNSEILEEFVKESGDDILKRVELGEKSDEESPDRVLFNSFVKKLAQENIVLSESLIKLAIAHITEDEVDEYEHDPSIRFAINHLRALGILDIARNP